MRAFVFSVCVAVLSGGVWAQSAQEREANGEAIPVQVGLIIRNGGLMPLRIDIPGVMQANFLPMSDSGATLRRGQALYFQHQGERTLLLRIPDTQQNGDVLMINELVAKRRAELNQRGGVSSTTLLNQ